MANQVQLTPEQAAAVQAFAAKYPGFDFRGLVGGGQGGNGAASYTKDPNGRQRFVDFMALKQQLAPALKHAHFTESGDVEKDMAWWKQALLAAGVVAAPMIAGAALAPGVVGAVAPTTFGATGPGIVEGTGLTGVDLTGMGAAKVGGGLFSKLAGPLIAGGTQIGSAAIQAHSNSEAAKIEAAAADKALAENHRIYEEHRADEAPYRQIGTGALGLLGQGMGIDMTPKPATPAPTMAPQANGGPMAALGPPTSPQASQVAFTSMRAPNGIVLQIPSNQVDQARAHGAQVVG